MSIKAINQGRFSNVLFTNPDKPKGIMGIWPMVSATIDHLLGLTTGNQGLPEVLSFVRCAGVSNRLNLAIS